MRVEADIDGSEIHVRVIDHGTWKTPAAHPRTRGRGFLVIQEVSDRVDVNHTAAGTTIDLTFSVPTKDRPS